MPLMRETNTISPMSIPQLTLVLHALHADVSLELFAPRPQLHLLVDDRMGLFSALHLFCFFSLLLRIGLRCFSDGIGELDLPGIWADWMR